MSAEEEKEAFDNFKGRELANAMRVVPRTHQLPVQWELTTAAMEAMLGVRPESADRLAGEFNDVRDVFLNLPEPQRMVFLGKVGAGKTILVNQLIKQLLGLKSEQLSERVPFYMSATSWDSSKDIMGWIADQLVRSNPELKRKVDQGQSKRVADAWAEGKILPVIDGLDELPSQMRIEAINKINDRDDIPVVVTSRPGEYIGAVHVEGQAISGAQVVEILPLDIRQAMGYLRETTSKTPSGRWGDVFTRLKLAEKEPDKDPLVRALTNPLMLWLASYVYKRKETAPGELADSSRFSDQDSIESHLLKCFVPALYPRNSISGQSPWSSKQAQRWLAYLAFDMERSHSKDLAWWRLARAVRRWRPIGVAVRAMLLFGVAWGAIVFTLEQLHEWPHGFRFHKQLLSALWPSNHPPRDIYSGAYPEASS